MAPTHRGVARRVGSRDDSVLDGEAKRGEEGGGGLRWRAACGLIEEGERIVARRPNQVERYTLGAVAVERLGG